MRMRKTFGPARTAPPAKEPPNRIRPLPAPDISHLAPSIDQGYNQTRADGLGTGLTIGPPRARGFQSRRRKRAWV